MSQVEHLPSLEIPAKPRWQYYLIDTTLATVGALFITALIYSFHLYPGIPIGQKNG